ncbi:MAG TPA: 30S ribosome-binding factor RbfA [Gaiellaceae bacterium]|jgi:ribosome-binding factor A
MRRVNEAVRAVVAEAIGGLRDPRLGVITVTAVRVSPDLHDARVYVSVFGGKKRRTRTMQALEASRSMVQGTLARELHMKRTPHLAFEYDQTSEEGVRLTKLIDDLAPETPSDDEPGDSDAE